MITTVILLICLASAVPINQKCEKKYAMRTVTFEISGGVNACLVVATQHAPMVMKEMQLKEDALFQVLCEPGQKT